MTHVHLIILQEINTKTNDQPIKAITKMQNLIGRPKVLLCDLSLVVKHL